MFGIMILSVTSVTISVYFYIGIKYMFIILVSLFNLCKNTTIFGKKTHTLLRQCYTLVIVVR
jgi:hypothetical protein